MNFRKIKGNSMDTKFAKASILGKPSLEPSRNHLVVRQPNAFTSERPRISRPRFASQVDEKNDLSKIVTPHYLPKYICQSFKGKTRSLVTKKTDISYVRSSRNSNLMNMLQMMFGQNSSSLVLHQMMSVHISLGLVLHLDVVWTKQFKPRSSSKDVWINRFKPRSLMSNLLASLQSMFLKVKKGVRLQRKGKCKSISLTEAEEEAVTREGHATHARIVSGPDPEPMQEDQTGSNSGKLHVSLAGPNPEHMDDEFLATAYPKVHENLKLITDERVISIENPESSISGFYIFHEKSR
ncbi:hypothetical protein Tco_0004747 [Tanacetum coccineum]